MHGKLRVLGIIPARGGSKGVPGKNIRLLCGKPLIAWTIQCARDCSGLDRVLVSTDSEEIAEIARQWGAETPFLRPAQLAQDDTPDLPVCRHALDWLEDHEQYRPDVVAWLRPTAPLRRPEDISTALDLLAGSDADCVRSVCRVEHHPYWMYRIEQNFLQPLMDSASIPTRRQDLPEFYRLNGAVDLVRRDRLPAGGHLFQGRMCGYVMPLERSVDIDQEADFRVAEAFLK